MSSLKISRFTRTDTLQRIGRKNWKKFFQRFEKELAESTIVLPDDALDDSEYYDALCALFMSPTDLPKLIGETLHAINELASEDGQERLVFAAQQANLSSQLIAENPTCEEIAMQLWLADNTLFTKAHNEQRLLQLTSFEHFSNRTESVKKFLPFTDEIKMDLTSIVDSWCMKHSRGNKTTKIEVYELNEEQWFLIHHGDTYTRTRKIESSERDIIHYRPEKDAVVVYSPSLNELRIYAGPKSEKETYCKAFGKLFFDDEDYFSHRNTYTLQPLRDDIIFALNTDNIPGIDKILLCEIEISWGGPNGLTVIKKSHDLGNSSQRDVEFKNPIPESGEIRCATFNVYFEGASKPRKIKIRLPNQLRLGRHCDAHLINLWLIDKEFRATPIGWRETNDSILAAS